MFIKVILLAFAGVIASLALKQIKPELAIFSAMGAGILILFAVLGEISGVVATFMTLTKQAESFGGGDILTSIVKIIGIGYVTEYSASVCDDFGSSSLAKKVQLGGKVSIFLISLPVVFSVIESVAKLSA
ncbi:MAG: stage III sporulation AC/AD family protein [Christensenellaceae bacterium]|jgi:stage III sporulation protein AD|nr:stage III sporulation AC/AD family protein [Christensenellaceae bacterium]